MDVCEEEDEPEGANDAYGSMDKEFDLDKKGGVERSCLGKAKKKVCSMAPTVKGDRGGCIPADR